MPRYQAGLGRVEYDPWLHARLQRYASRTVSCQHVIAFGHRPRLAFRRSSCLYLGRCRARLTPYSKYLCLLPWKCEDATCFSCALWRRLRDDRLVYFRTSGSRSVVRCFVSFYVRPSRFVADPAIRRHLSRSLFEQVPHSLLLARQLCRTSLAARCSAAWLSAYLSSALSTST